MSRPSPNQSAPDFGQDPWVLVVTGIDSQRVGVLETILSLGNGHIGVRGTYEQGGPFHQPGTLVNGFHETWPIEYPEAAYGYATMGQTIVYVPDATELAVQAPDGHLLRLDQAQVSRTLDLRKGILTTTARWPELAFRWERLVSLTRPSLMVIRLTMLGDDQQDHSWVSGWHNRQDLDHLTEPGGEFDPRRTRALGRRVLQPYPLQVNTRALSTTFRTAASGMHLAMAIDHGPTRSPDAVERTPVDEFTFTFAGYPVEKRVAYVLGDDPELAEQVLAKAPDFEGLAVEQAAALNRFWNVAGVELGGVEPTLQQAVNWILFQLHQASALLQGTGIPAKGLSGQAYEGHYFWDTDVFVLPFLANTNPSAAAELIRFRYRLLGAARRRARVLNQRGALYPWRTINGEEASAYYEAGTAQYHIDAAVIYGLNTYLAATGDDGLLWECGVEIAIETARLWADLGFYRDDRFHLHMVTGPDEYSALVDDNAYTNLMARFNLERALVWTERMRVEQPDGFARLAVAVGLDDSELADWRRAAIALHIPHDSVRGITPQDARFLEREEWDWTTPRERYPLLLHFHPLVIYRHQVIKQADVVMAMFLLPHQFDSDLARANFDFYDPLTTGDSSLSAAVQATVAARVGRDELALDYFRHAAFLDLANHAGNTADGIHLAAAAGVWHTLVSGFGGFHFRDTVATFDPHLPPGWDHLHFSVMVRGSRVRVEVDHASIVLCVENGPPVEIEVRDQKFPIDREPLRIGLSTR